MVSDVLGIVLTELGRLLNIPDLKPDQNNTCLIKMPKGPKIQLEMAKTGDGILIGIELGQVPPGRYRIDVLKEALKSNGLPLPRYGIFAWSRKADTLILYKKFPLKDLTGEKIAAFLSPFIEKANKWTEALAKGEV